MLHLIILTQFYNKAENTSENEMKNENYKYINKYWFNFWLKSFTRVRELKINKWFVKERNNFQKSNIWLNKKIVRQNLMSNLKVVLLFLELKINGRLFQLFYRLILTSNFNS
jgi:hypothetical protein